jgi:methionyl-tRNA formyltransferase
MKICFMGTPSFAVHALKAILKAGYNVSHVYTKEPKPKGRGEILQKSQVHEYAENIGIPVLTPKSLKKQEVQQEFIAQNFDVCVVASYGLLLPKVILEAPKHGCINIHGSLLPRWRGASPIQMAIAAGDSTTGITTMQMGVGLDDGDMLLKAETPITKDTTFLSLYEELSHIGASLIVETLKKLEQGQLTPIKQDDALVTHAKILLKEDGLITFNEPAEVIERKIRAFNPFPSTYFVHNNEIFKILKASVVKEKHQLSPGEIISQDGTLKIACEQDVLQIQIIQRQGKKALPIEDFLKGFRFC